ncbi:MAG TPA: substrate-binding domain-containing protein [Gemmataceae bacterium]|jgi:ribose transport system substrate-binding protein
MKSLRVLGWLAAGLLLAASLGCNRGPAKTKVAFVSNNAESFWSIAEAGTQKAAAEENVEVIFEKPQQGDAALQKEKLDTVMSRGIKALAVSVIDPDNQAAYLNEIAEKIPLLTQDNDAPNTKRKCYIGTDNYRAGKAVGELIQEILPDGGIIVVFVGDLKPLNAQQRRQGVLDQLAGAKDAKGEKTDDGEKYGKYTLYKTYLDMPEGPQKAKENAVDAIAKLESKKQPICMVGLWAYNPPAILSAVKDKGKEGKIKIVGFDEDSATLQGIADGSVYATVVQQPFQFGYEAVKMMAALARGDNSKVPADGILYVPHRVITKDGGKDRVPVEKFRKELDRLLGK